MTQDASVLDREALGVVRVVGNPVEMFAFHGPAVATEDASNVDLQVDVTAATIEVAFFESIDRTRSDDWCRARRSKFFRRRFKAMTTA